MKRRDESKIRWDSVGFKEHMAMDTHWELLGVIRETGEEKFMIFCEKGSLETFLEILETKEKILIPSGARQKAMELALKIYENIS